MLAPKGIRRAAGIVDLRAACQPEQTEENCMSFTVNML